MKIRVNKENLLTCLECGNQDLTDTTKDGMQIKGFLCGKCGIGARLGSRGG